MVHYCVCDVGERTKRERVSDNAKKDKLCL